MALKSGFELNFSLKQNSLFLDSPFSSNLPLADSGYFGHEGAVEKVGEDQISVLGVRGVPGITRGAALAHEARESGAS